MESRTQPGLLSETHATYRASGHRKSGHGIVYAEHVIMWVFLRGGSTSEGLEFCLASEMDAAEKFDDLVLQYRKPEGTFLDFLQIKHKSNDSNKITANDLANQRNGDYSLRKYFLSFVGIKRNPLFQGSILEDLVIWTNATFHMRKLEENDIGVREVAPNDNILNMNPQVRYKLVLGKDHALYLALREAHGEMSTGEVDDEIDEFLDKMVFATNQPNLKQMEVLVKEEICHLGNPERDSANVDFIYSLLKCKISSWIADSNATFLTDADAKHFLSDVEEKTLGKVWFEVGHLVDTFTGRETELKALHEALNGDLPREDFTLISHVGSVSGLGGVGKTELARKYAHRYAAHFNLNVIWIHAESHRSMKASFSRLADRLRILLVDQDKKERDVESIVRDVYRFFSNKKCLFVFDNAEKFVSETEGDAGINKFLVSLPPGHQVSTLITSRCQDWGNVKSLIVDKFKPEEAVAFIRKELDIEEGTEDEEVIKLSELLDCFPLALRQAVSYIKEEKKNCEVFRETFLIKDYISLYEDKLGKDKELVDYKMSDKRPDCYLQTTYTTWQVTQDIIKNKPNGELALKILNIMAFVQPDNIQVKPMFTELKKHIKELGSAINLLKSYSMIYSGADKSLLNIHRLVQEVTRIKLKEQNQVKNVLKEALMLQCLENLKECVDHFLKIWSFARDYEELIKEFCSTPAAIVMGLNNNVRYKNAYDFGVGEEVCLRNVISENHESFFKLRHWIGCALFSLGRYDECLEIQGEIFEKLYFSRGLNHPETLTVGHFIASVLHKAGMLCEAQELHEKVYEARNALLGADHVDTLHSKHNLTWTLWVHGRYDEALERLKEIYRKQEAKQGSDHPQLVPVRNNIASVLDNLGRYDEAMELYNANYEKQKRTLGTDHPEVLMTRQNIAFLLQHQGNYDEALEIYNDVYNKRLVFQDAGHPDALDTKNTIASVLCSQGKYDEALETYKQVYEKQINIFEPFNFLTLLTRQHIACVLEKKGKYDEALDIHEEIYEKHRQSYGEDYPQTLTARQHIASVLDKKGKYDEALDIYKEIYNKRQVIQGISHQDTLTTRSNIVSIYYEQGKYNEVLNIYNEVYKKQRQTFGEEHPCILATRTNICSALDNLGKCDEALNVCRDILQKKLNTIGPNNPSTLSTRNIIATLLNNQCKYQEALKVFNEVYEKQRDVLGSSHPDTLSTRNNIASVYFQQGKFREALLLKKVIHKLQVTLLGPRHPNSLETQDQIDSILEAQSKLGEALELCERIERLKLETRNVIRNQLH